MQLLLSLRARLACIPMVRAGTRIHNRTLVGLHDGAARLICT